jgi:hypothetical protein
MTDMCSRCERGFYHLTPEGWRRVDCQPFPPDRIETWAYELGCTEGDTRDKVRLTRTWVHPGMSWNGCDAIRSYHGNPLLPSTHRSILMECEV